MPVVSNPSPVLNLAIIGELSILQKQFREILIPKAVLKELHVEDELPGSKALHDAIESGWIKIEEAKDDGIARAMQRDLDVGESEAIALAMQVNAEWILMDERDGRKAARSMHLKTIGALGILLKASREGDLKSLRQAMDRLRGKAGFYIQAELYNALLREAGEINY